MSEKSLKIMLQKILRPTLVNIFIYFQEEVSEKGNFTSYFQILVFSIKHYPLKPFPFSPKKRSFI